MDRFDDLEAVFPVRFFRALSEPNRLKALFVIARYGRACTVGEVAAECPTDLSVTSRHLIQLRDAGILSSQKEGRRVYYRLNHLAFARTLRACALICEAGGKDDHQVLTPGAASGVVLGNPPEGVPGIY